MRLCDERVRPADPRPPAPPRQAGNNRALPPDPGARQREDGKPLTSSSARARAAGRHPCRARLRRCRISDRRSCCWGAGKVLLVHGDYWLHCVSEERYNASDGTMRRCITASNHWYTISSHS
eukprot:765697-Hanusia_phi.AAC.3